MYCPAKWSAKQKSKFICKKKRVVCFVVIFSFEYNFIALQQFQKFGFRFSFLSIIKFSFINASCHFTHFRFIRHYNTMSFNYIIANFMWCNTIRLALGIVSICCFYCCCCCCDCRNFNIYFFLILRTFCKTEKSIEKNGMNWIGDKPLNCLKSNNYDTGQVK